MSDDCADDVIEDLLDQLAEGRSLLAICASKRMPARKTVYRWAEKDSDLAARILEAREVGYHARAERAVEAAKAATDPIAGRLAFDAERWYLGKLSNAFADKPIAIGAVVNVDAGDVFAAIAGALESAAGTIAGRASNTRSVVIESEARSDHAAGRLADMGGISGPRLGQDADRG